MLNFSHRAYIQINTLQTSMRKKVEQAMKRVEQSQADWATLPDVRKLAKPEGVYMVPVGSSLRVFFQRSVEGIEIVDIIPQESIDEFHKARVAAGEL